MQFIVFIVWEFDPHDRYQTPCNHGYFSSEEKAQQYCDVTVISGQSHWHIETVEVQ